MIKNFTINITFVVFTIFGAMSYASNLPEHIIPITKPSEVVDFKLVDDALNSLIDSVGKCAESGEGDYPECTCMFPDKTKQLETAIQYALEKYPQWGQEGKGLYYYDKEKNFSSNIFLSAIRLQLVSQCKG